MKFTHPSFLYAAFLVALPIIIHLIYFRKHKRIIFPSLVFLKEIKKEKQSVKRLKDWLLLLLRSLAFLALIVAFAQPFIPKRNTSTSGTNWLYLDNSPSMFPPELSETGLPQAKNLAKSIVKSANKNNWKLITQNSLAGSRTALSGKSIEEKIDRTKISNNSKDFNTVYRQLQSYGLDSNDNVFVLSDFQKQQFSNIPKSLLGNYYLVPLEPVSTENIGIDSVWFTSPNHLSGASESIKAKVVNYSDKEYEQISVTLRLNKKQVGISTVSLKPFQSQEIEISYLNPSSTWVNGELRIKDYPFTFDDSKFFSYKIVPSINVICIAEKEPKEIARIFQNDEEFTYSFQNTFQLDFTGIKNADAIILANLNSIPNGLNDILKQKVEKGSSLILFPGENLEKENYNTFLSSLEVSPILGIDSSQTLVEKYEISAPFINDVFERIPTNPTFPKVQKYYKILNTRGNALLYYLNTNSVLTQTEVGQGNVYLWSLPLSRKWSSLSQHALFPTFTVKMVQEASKGKAYIYSAGNKNSVAIDGNNILAEKLELKKEGETQGIIPDFTSYRGQNKLDLSRFDLTPGNYTLSSNDSTLVKIGVNNSKLESNPSYFTGEEIAEKFKVAGGNTEILGNTLLTVESEIREVYEGKQLWKYFILLALFFVLIEILILRLVK